MADLIGHDIGRYHITEQLGQGGMAVVYKAYDTRLDRDVAIKVIRMRSFAPDVVEHMLKRFEREAKSLARLEHPNIIPIHDYGEHEGAPYLVMRYVPGGTLKNQAGRAMPYAEAARLLAPVAHALEYAHQHGVVHRDVKPANILVTEEGVPMLSDFGVAKILESEEGSTLTGTGVGVGTPEYMAPEQWMNKVVPQTDIYSLGVVFYELVTGRKPYTADTPAAVLIKQTNDPLPRPRQFVPDLPEGVEKVIYRAMAKRAEDRYASMGEFAAALEKLGLQAEPRKTSKPVPEMAGPGSKPIKENPPIRASNPGADETWDSGQAGVPTGAVKRGGVPVWAYLVGGVLVLGLIAGGVMLGLGIGSGKAVPTVNIQVINTLTPMVNRTEAPISSSPAADTPFTGTRSSPQSNPVGQYKVGSVQVSPKDGMTMVIVPEGDFIMGTADSDKSAPIGEKPQHTVFLDSYWIDQTDVTNAMYVKCVKDGACKESTFKDAPDFNGDNQPVIGIGWDSAKAYCQWAGRRLPTEAEWEKAARGTDGLIYPWGNQPPNGSLANFNKSGGKTADVGSFPAGASPYGALDMAGNVWQWVADWYDPSYYQSMTTWRNPTGPSSGYTRVVRGGSLFFGPDDVRSAVRVVNYASSGRSYFGFRCAESAGTTAASQAPVVTETASTLFARTGNSVSNLDGMKLMYIPAGAFQMGSEKGNSDEGPVHTVALDAFWIDQTDITNAMYAMCVSAKVCNEPWATGSYSRPIYYGNFLYADYPVVDVDWSQADAYCKWAGRSLPTEAQWEKAARGTDGRTYPWGEGVNLSKANYNGSDTTKAGSYPNGASPYGALDMAGNVLQWVADWYNSDYYAKSLEKDPPGPSSGNGRVMRGGSWHANEDNVRSSVRSVYKPSEWYSYLGFRCAMSAAP